MESGIVRKAMVYLGIVDDESPDLDVCDDAPEPVCVDPPPPTVRVVPTDPPKPEPKPAHMRVRVVTPTSFGDVQEITDLFREDQPVIVNLQNADQALTRRLIDFCSGATYALNGSMEKIAHHVLLLTPTDVEVSADERGRWLARPVRA
jgi:cell division inhibitor SepF